MLQTKCNKRLLSDTRPLVISRSETRFTLHVPAVWTLPTEISIASNTYTQFSKVRHCVTPCALHSSKHGNTASLHAAAFLPRENSSRKLKKELTIKPWWSSHCNPMCWGMHPNTFLVHAKLLVQTCALIDTRRSINKTQREPCSCSDHPRGHALLKSRSHEK